MKGTRAIVLFVMCLLPCLLPGIDITTVVSGIHSEATAYCNGRKLAVDENGRIHVCYWIKPDPDHSTVYYIYSDDQGSSWSTPQLVKTTDCSHPCAMAVDPETGTPYIAVHSEDGGMYLWTPSPSIRRTFSTMQGVLPSVALNPDQDLGIIYAIEDQMIFRAQLFDMDDLSTPEGWKSIGASDKGKLMLASCCWRGNDAVAAASGYGWNPKFPLVRRLDTRPWGNSNLWVGNNDVHGHPSLTTIGNQVWAVYFGQIVEPNHAGTGIAYKRAWAPAYEFEDEYHIITSNAGMGNLLYEDNKAVQIADGFPFVVWEKVFMEGEATRAKIYYAYPESYSGFGFPTWTTERLTTSDPEVVERSPHAAVDYVNKKIYVIWAENNSGGLKMATLGFGDIGRDTLVVTQPQGGEKWSRGLTEKIQWLRLTNDNPANIYLHYTTDCNSENPTWYLINSFGELPNSAQEFDWKVGRNSDGKYWSGYKSDYCRIRVTVVYDPTHIKSDYSGIFTIGPFWVDLYPPGGGHITSMMSSGNGDNGPGDIGWNDAPLGYIEPSDTFHIPWEVWNLTSLDTAILQFSSDGGLTFTNAVGGLPSDSSIIDTSFSGNDTFFLWKYVDTLTWISPSNPTNGGYFRLMAIDSASDTAYSEAKGPFYVITPGGFQLSTFANQNIMGFNDAADKIGLAYTSTISGSVNYNVVYMESEDGLDFSSPDTIALGNSAGFSGGACAWKKAKVTVGATKDSLYYAYQTGGSFSTPYLLQFITSAADSGSYAPVGILSENDTVHMIVKATKAYRIDEVGYSGVNLMHLKFLEDSPGRMLSVDTLVDSSAFGTTLYDPAPIAPTLVKNDSIIYGAYTIKNSCGFCTINPSSFRKGNIGYGSHPHIGISEGNITYTYLDQGDTALIRLWRYIEDTAWVECDTFKLDTVATFLTGDRGILFGVQYAGSGPNADVFGYSPTAETFLRQGYYTGYYAHPYVDDKADEFSWVVAYADYADDSAYTFLHTIRRPLYVPITAAYMESDTKRSPWTLVRDTCITYGDITVDSAQDSLVYRIPCLNDDLDYSLTLHFYHEADSTTQLQITVGSNVDTFEVATEQGALFHDSIPSNTDTLNIKIKRLSSSSYTFVPLSRIIVRRRSAEGIYVMGDVAEKPEQTKLSFCLYQPFPNPFNKQATIKFALPYATHVSLKVYDVTGRLVTTLVNERLDAGEHAITWSGRDGLNRQCSSGVYFVSFAADKYVASKKMVLLK